MAKKKSNPIVVAILCSILFGLLVVMPGALAINYYLNRKSTETIRQEIEDEFGPIRKRDDKFINAYKRKTELLNKIGTLTPEEFEELEELSPNGILSTD